MSPSLFKSTIVATAIAASSVDASATGNIARHFASKVTGPTGQKFMGSSTAELAQNQMQATMAAFQQWQATNPYTTANTFSDQQKRSMCTSEKLDPTPHTAAEMIQQQEFFKTQCNPSGAAFSLKQTGVRKTHKMIIPGHYDHPLDVEKAKQGGGDEMDVDQQGDH